MLQEPSIGETRAAVEPRGRGPAVEVFQIFLKLGVTSFGGPVAHLGYFREEFVARRRWFDDKTYGDVVALCQFLPGAASSKVGMAIGLWRAGYPGMFAAWVAFTLPSAVALILFALGVQALGDATGAGWLRGFKIVAVAVVAQAVLGMAQNLCPDRERATFAAVAAAIALFVPSVIGQIGAIVLGAIAGLIRLRADRPTNHVNLALPVGRTAGAIALLVFFVLLLGLPIVSAAADGVGLAMFEKFYRTGSLVFGGGHVVLPLLQAEVVDAGWVDRNLFVAGYGAAQAVPGPLFTFAAYLGFASGPAPNGMLGATICLIAIFLPSFLLVVGTLPFWDAVRTRPEAQATLRGVNAAVVGVLLAALYNPVWITGIHVPADFALVAAAFLLLFMWKTPPWLVVVLTALAGSALNFFGV